MYEINIVYDERTISTGLIKFWVKLCGRDTIIGFFLLGIGFSLWFSGSKTWITATFIALSAIFIFIMIGTFFVYRKRSTNTFKEMESPNALWRFSDDSFSVESDIGKSEFKWSLIKKLWKFTDVWILMYSNQSISILPVKDLSEEIKNYLLNKIQSNRGKII